MDGGRRIRPDRALLLRDGEAAAGFDALVARTVPEIERHEPGNPGVRGAFRAGRAIGAQLLRAVRPTVPPSTPTPDLAAFSGLRWGEPAALRPHMLAYVGPEPDALIFTGAKGAVLRSSNFHGATKWVQVVSRLRLPAGFHFHDLRSHRQHARGGIGREYRELMHRMGHASMRAALIYQHATSERDREIAGAMDKRISDETGKKAPKKSRRNQRSDAKSGPTGAVAG